MYQEQRREVVAFPLIDSVVVYEIARVVQDRLSLVHLDARDQMGAVPPEDVRRVMAYTSFAPIEGQ